MKYFTRKDIFKAAAKEAGISQEFMEVIFKNLFQTVRSYLVNPLDNWKGILLNKFIKIYLQPTAVRDKRFFYKKDILEQIHKNLEKDEQEKKRKTKHE